MCARDIARVLFDTLTERKLGDVPKLCYEMQIEQGVLTDERLKQINSLAPLVRRLSINLGIGGNFHALGGPHGTATSWIPVEPNHHVTRRA
jgi:hypothetical protein